MTFEPSNELPPDPAVKIFFTGLLILRPLPHPDTTCRVFVHNSSSLHHLLIEVRRKRCNQPDVIMARIPGPLASTGGAPHQSDGVLIRKVTLDEDQPIQTAVKAYTGDPVPNQGTKLDDSFILSRFLSVPPGDVDPVRARPSVLINDGIFYTAAITEVRAELRRNDRSPTTVLTQVPTIIGANIYLKPEDEAVNVAWRQQGLDVSLALTREPDTSYEIYINNEPLFEEDGPLAPEHDEFDEYFKLLPAVPENKRFSLVFPTTPIPDRGSSRTPCLSIVIGD